MIVLEKDFDEVLGRIKPEPLIAFDVETTGLRPWHGDSIFGVAIATANETFYFDFLDRGGEHPGLPQKHLHDLAELFKDCTRTVCGHNLKFDLTMLRQAGFRSIWSNIHCTMVTARLLKNDELTYSLDACAKRVGLEKDKTVEEYIKKHKLYEIVSIPGKKTRFRNDKYSGVPLEIIAPYAEQDARLAFILAERQLKELEELSASTPDKLPNIKAVYQNEMTLIHTCMEIEETGILIDGEYIERAIAYEEAKGKELKEKIEAAIGFPFVDSRQCLTKIFPNAQVKLTEKGNMSFQDEELAKIDHPTAALIRDLRDCLKRLNTYFKGFRYHRAKDGRVHCQMNQAATVTGRFSVTEPALQTLSKDKEDSPFPIRRAFIPTPGNALVEMDYKSMEFVMMCDYAGELKLIEKLKAGHDPHQATADMTGVTRQQAKTLNFMLLYGGGAAKLAASLKITVEAAKKLKWKYFDALPAVREFINQAGAIAKARGFVFNFLGRRFQFGDPNFAYKAPNAIIQGGGADTCKVAMNRICGFLRGHKTRMVLQIHDAILFDVPPQEFWLIPHLKSLMEEAYPHRHIPLTVSVSHSFKSWGDLTEGGPVGAETGDDIQQSGQEVPTGVGQMLVHQDARTLQARHSGFFDLPQALVHCPGAKA